jgi:hypothetical protein
LDGPQAGAVPFIDRGDDAFFIRRWRRSHFFRGDGVQMVGRKMFFGSGCCIPATARLQSSEFCASTFCKAGNALDEKHDADRQYDAKMQHTAALQRAEWRKPPVTVPEKASEHRRLPPYR